MKKVVIISLLIALVVTIFTILPGFNITGDVTKSDIYSYSTAICDEDKLCEDYYVECEGNTMKKLTPTGFTIQQDRDWVDSRKNVTNFCN